MPGRRHSNVCDVTPTELYRATHSRGHLAYVTPTKGCGSGSALKKTAESGSQKKIIRI